MQRTQLLVTFSLSLGLLFTAPSDNFGMVMILIISMLGMGGSAMMFLDDLTSIRKRKGTNDTFMFNPVNAYTAMEILEREFSIRNTHLQLENDPELRHEDCVHANDPGFREVEMSHLLILHSLTLNKHGRGFIEFTIVDNETKSAINHCHEAALFGTDIQVLEELTKVPSRWSRIFW